MPGSLSQPTSESELQEHFPRGLLRTADILKTEASLDVRFHVCGLPHGGGKQLDELLAMGGDDGGVVEWAGESAIVGVGAGGFVEADAVGAGVADDGGGAMLAGVGGGGARGFVFHALLTRHEEREEKRNEG